MAVGAVTVCVDNDPPGLGGDDLIHNHDVHRVGGLVARDDRVVLDRFYASWASAEAGAGNLRITDLSIDSWPRDLIKPDLSIHLRVDEEERLKRIGKRDYQNQREIKLGNDHSYRFRVIRGLTRLTDCDVDNTFRSPEETAAAIIELYNTQIKTRMMLEPMFA